MTKSLRLLRRFDVENLTGLARSTIYAAIAEGKFPAPVKIGPRAVAWRESDVRKWIEERPSARPNCDSGGQI